MPEEENIYEEIFFTKNPNFFRENLKILFFEIYMNIRILFFPDQRGAGLQEAFKFLSVLTSVRLQFVQLCPTQPIYLRPPQILLIPEPL